VLGVFIAMVCTLTLMLRQYHAQPSSAVISKGPSQTLLINMFSVFQFLLKISNEGAVKALPSSLEMF